MGTWRNIPNLCLLLSALCLAACSSTPVPSRIVRKNGSVVVGTIAQARPDALVIRTAAGDTLVIARDDIVSIERADAAATTPGTHSGGADAGAPSSASRNPGTSRGVTGGPAAPVARRGEGPPPAPGSAHQVTMPAGTRLTAALESTIDPNNTEVGESVTATLTRPLVIAGVEALRVGTVISGTIVQVAAPSHVKSGVVVLRFDALNTEAGDVPIHSEPIRRTVAATGVVNRKKHGRFGALLDRSKSVLGFGDGDAAHPGQTRVPAGTVLSVTVTAPVIIAVAARQAIR